MIESISKFRPAETVFEVGKRGTKSSEAVLMGKRRSQLATVIGAVKEQRKELQQKSSAEQTLFIENRKKESVDDDEGLLALTSSTKVAKKKLEATGDYRDEEHYMGYRPADADTERGYSMQNADSAGPVSFLEKAKTASFAIVGDDEDALKPKKGSLTWDSRKHRFVRPTVGADNKKMIRSETGALLPASYKTKR
jgi:ATP-dependent RNA helicase DDX54/DBP10